MAFTTPEQLKAGVVSKNVTAPLLRHELQRLKGSVSTQLLHVRTRHNRLALVRDVGLFAVAIHTGERGTLCYEGPDSEAAGALTFSAQPPSSLS